MSEIIGGGTASDTTEVVSFLYVRYNEQLESNLTARVVEEEELESYVDVKNSEDLNSYAVIWRKEEEELSSYLLPREQKENEIYGYMVTKIKEVIVVSDTDNGSEYVEIEGGNALNFPSYLSVDNGIKSDLSSVIYTRVFDEPQNSMYGNYVLYKGNDSELDSTIFIYTHILEDLDSSARVRVPRIKDLNSELRVVYAGRSEMFGYIEAVANNFMGGFLWVEPHNRMFGEYELMEAPRITTVLSPVADASTRSRIDLQTINYGSEQKMNTGIFSSPLAVEDETLESFIKFDIHGGIGVEKLIESATLRLYHQDATLEGRYVELQTSKYDWSEMGITHANKPIPDEVVGSEYTSNLVERYIEYDVTDIIKEMYDFEKPNYGFNIFSTDEQITFYTKESPYANRKPTLTIKYIDLNAVFSAGKYLLDAYVDIIGRGHAEIKGYLEVDSTFDKADLNSSIYVHQWNVPVENELGSIVTASIPDLSGYAMIYLSDESTLDSHMTVQRHGEKTLTSKMASSIPDLNSSILLDPNAYLKSYLNVAHVVNDDINIVPERDMLINLASNMPDLDSYMNIVGHVWLDGYINVPPSEWREISGYIGIPTYVDDLVNSPERETDVYWTLSKPELKSTIRAVSVGESSIDGYIEVYQREYLDGTVAMTRPDLDSTVMIKIPSMIDGTIEVKQREFLDSEITIKIFNELDSFLVVDTVSNLKSEMVTTKPEMLGYIFRRYVGEKDLYSVATFRAKDVSDLHGRFGVRGEGGGAYYFIL